jgi:hypothetical protein
LDFTHVDVSVDLTHIVGRTAHVMLNEVPALQNGDLGNSGANLHTHEVATHWTALAFLTAPLLKDLRGKLSCGLLTGTSTTTFLASLTAATTF